MLYENTGILVDLVPCFKFPSEMRHILPKVNKGVIHYLTELASRPSTEPNNHEKKSNVYDIQPLYLVCYDDEKPNGPYTDCILRLSTSLFEKFFYRRLETNVAEALRVFRYLLQTFPSQLGEANGVWQKQGFVKPKKTEVGKTPQASSSKKNLFEKAAKFFKLRKNDTNKSDDSHVVDSHDDSYNALITFGCKSSISSYFFTNLILKLISTGEVLAIWKDKSPGTVFIFLLKYIINLLKTIPSEEVLMTDHDATIYHHVSVGSWFFEDKSFACKTIALTEDEIYGLRSWLQGVLSVFTSTLCANHLYSQFPLRCVIPKVKCNSCKKHDSFDVGIEEVDSMAEDQCHIHQLVLFGMGVEFPPIDVDDIWEGLFHYSEKCRDSDFSIGWF